MLRRAFDFEVEGQRKKSRPRRTWKGRLRRMLFADQSLIFLINRNSVFYFLGQL